MRRAIQDKNILFLCDDNARLSQMAEASAKHLAPPKTRIFSAGIKPGVVSLQVIQAMQELGVSMLGQRSKSLSDVPINEIDLVVSFGDAHKQCANLPGRVKIEIWKLPVPPAKDDDSPTALTAMREERDEIDKRVFALFLDHWRNVS